MTLQRIDLTTAIIINTAAEWAPWLANAQPGDVALYHDGYLAAYRPPNGPADDALAASDRDLVRLVQIRAGESRFRYYAIRSAPAPVRAKRQTTSSKGRVLAEAA